MIVKPYLLLVLFSESWLLFTEPIHMLGKGILSIEGLLNQFWTEKFDLS